MSAKKLRITLLLASTLRGASLFAQGQPAPAQVASPVASGTARLTGTITNSATGQPLAYASVAVLSAAGLPVGGGVGGGDGRFVLAALAPGTYTVRVSLLGYQELVRAGIVVPTGGGDVALGALPLVAAAQKLDEVVITARKPLIEELVDRTVYNAENDETTRGGDATDVLRRVPLLSLDLDGNVSVRGSQNIKVLINNKPSTITANSVADGLRQLPADQIRRVEVITSPSAKYDAEGSGGIINIVTKTNTLRGGQLALDGSGGTRSGTLNLSGNYRTGRMGWALGGFGRAGYNTPGSFTNEQLTTNPATGAQTRTTQSADTRQNQLFGRYTLGWDFDIDPHQGLAATLTYGTRNATTYQDALATATTQLASGRLSNSVRNVQLTDESGTVDASLAYTHTYDVPQRELSALALYSRNNRTYAFTNATYSASDASQLGLSGNDNPSANQEITAQLDYQTPTGPGQLLEVGVKDIQRRVRSDYRYYGQLATAQAANSFTYRQQVAAGYAVYTVGLPHGFTLKPGVRYEYTALGAELGTGPVADLPNYGLLVPSVNVLRKLGNGNVLKLSYNRRIQRPSLQFLNPNLQAANPLLQTQGNPALRPEYTNNYELGYGTLLGPANLNFSVFARNTTGAIQSVRTALNDASYPGAVRIDYLNIGQENAYGGSAFFNLDVGTKLSLSGGLDAYYAVLQNNVADPNYAARNAGWVLGGRLYGSYALPKGWNVQLFSFYRGQQVQLQGTQSSFVLYSMSLKHDVAGKKGSLGLGAENFFSPTNAVRSNIASPLLSQRSTTVQHLTSFKVYFSYRIGQLTAEPRPHKNVKNDDLKTDENGGGNQSNSATPAASRPVVPAPSSAPVPAATPATTTPAPTAPVPPAPKP
ncbi:MAG: TonB-dependent receptor domain-containing protein [Janthinobacterium lividum]